MVTKVTSCWTLPQIKFFIRRDITYHTFHEDVFPFKVQTSQTPYVFPLTTPSTPSLPPTFFELVLHIHTPAPLVPTTSSGRQVKPPRYLNDYISGVVPTSCSYSLNFYFNLSNLTPSYFAFICSITDVPGPFTYAQASVHLEWREAMQLELEALK